MGIKIWKVRYVYRVVFGASWKIVYEYMVSNGHREVLIDNGILVSLIVSF